MCMCASICFPYISPDVQNNFHPQDADGEWTCAAGFAGEAFLDELVECKLNAIRCHHFCLIKYGGFEEIPRFFRGNPKLGSSVRGWFEPSNLILCHVNAWGWSGWFAKSSWAAVLRWSFDP